MPKINNLSDKICRFSHLEESVALVSEQSQGRFRVRGVAQFQPATSGQELGTGDDADWILAHIS